MDQTELINRRISLIKELAGVQQILTRAESELSDVLKGGVNHYNTDFQTDIVKAQKELLEAYILLNSAKNRIKP